MALDDLFCAISASGHEVQELIAEPIGAGSMSCAVYTL